MQPFSRSRPSPTRAIYDGHLRDVILITYRIATSMTNIDGTQMRTSIDGHGAMTV